MAVHVRGVVAADHDAWLDLWRGYQVFYKADIPAETSRVTWARFLDPAEPVHAALAFDAGGAAIGLAHWLMHRSTWAVADFCYLNDLFVAAEQRGAGVGRTLIGHVAADARAAGCAQVYWLTHQTNTTAMRLYDAVATRTGFVHYGKSPP